MRRSNPAFKMEAFKSSEQVFGQERTMTVQGAVDKTFIMLFIILGTAGFAWYNFYAGATLTYPLLMIGVFGGLIMALITIFNPKNAPITAPIYAAFEGLFLGALSATFNYMYPGIVIQAVGLTMGVLFVMLAAYRTGFIKVTEKFRSGVIAATGAVFLVYMMTFLLGMFGLTVPYIHQGGPIGIGISLVVIVIAALNLVLDFDFIEENAKRGAPKSVEWLAAFGLIVTLVWLYIEILNLLSMFMGDD